jgi:hypothetical protein
MVDGRAVEKAQNTNGETLVSVKRRRACARPFTDIPLWGCE